MKWSFQLLSQVLQFTKLWSITIFAAFNETKFFINDSIHTNLLGGYFKNKEHFCILYSACNISHNLWGPKQILNKCLWHVLIKIN